MSKEPVVQHQTHLKIAQQQQQQKPAAVARSQPSSKGQAQENSSKESRSSQGKKHNRRVTPKRLSKEPNAGSTKIVVRKRSTKTGTPKPHQQKEAEPEKPEPQLFDAIHKGEDEEKPAPANVVAPAAQNVAVKPHENRETRGKKAPPHLPNGLILCNRLKIERMLGGGGFGQVFKAVDQFTTTLVAIKVEPCDREAGRMILEQKVLTLLRGTKHTPKLIASGNYGNFMYIAMEMLGRNLNDLRHRQPNKRFTIGTGLRVGVQMVEAISDIHSVSYLHRDIKPSNMCIGLTEETRRIIYLVDFGMTRRFRNENGEFRKSRSYAGFRGTVRYVSLTVHERRDQGPVDDLWSLLYSIIELCEGGLPWKHIEDDDDMALKKKRTPIEEMLTSLPRSIKEIADHLETLTYDCVPNYALITRVYMNAMPSDVTNDTPFDWEGLNPSSKSLELESFSNRA